MTRAEAQRRALDAVLGATPAGTSRDVAELLAIMEAAGGLCPRDGRILLGVLVGNGLLAWETPTSVRRA